MTACIWFFVGLAIFALIASFILGIGSTIFEIFFHAFGFVFRMIGTILDHGFNVLGLLLFITVAGIFVWAIHFNGGINIF